MGGRRRRRVRGSAWLGRGLAAGLAASGCTGADAGRGSSNDTPAGASGEVTAGATAGAAGTAGMPGGASSTAGFGNPIAGVTGFAGSGVVAPTGSGSVPADFLAGQPVDNAAPFRRVLYSWTTDEQYDELRANPVLLTRTERPGLGGGLIRETLASLAAAGDPLSQALQAPEFQAARYAWPNPWATLMGWPGESYGNRLIEIELRDEAWVMTLMGGQWQVLDADNVPVSRKDAIENPQRIGAIYHFHEPDEYAECGGSFAGGGAGAYREYFLPNEAMVARWSLATEDMRARLESDIEMLETFRDSVGGGATGSWSWPSFENDALCTWRGITYRSEGTPTLAYLQSLALTSAFYAPGSVELDALIAALRDTLFEPDPFVVEPE